MEARKAVPLSVEEMVQKSKDAGEPDFFPIMVRRDVLERLIKEAASGPRTTLNSTA